MKSRPSRARSSRAPSGVDSTGLPALVISARTWPSPGVSISSASTPTGSSPNTSGAPRTRECQRPVRKPLPRPPGPCVLDAPAAARGNIAPPTRSRLPVSALSTSTSHEASVPNSCVQVPMRPYTAARGAPASERATRSIVAAGIPVTSATGPGAKSAASARTASTPARWSTGVTSPSASSTCTSANRNRASVPGRMNRCSSASSAVRERRGSTTTTCPPRARSARSRPRMSGAVISEPLEASGLAPSTSR